MFDKSLNVALLWKVFQFALKKYSQLSLSLNFLSLNFLPLSLSIGIFVLNI